MFGLVSVPSILHWFLPHEELLGKRAVAAPPVLVRRALLRKTVWNHLVEIAEQIAPREVLQMFHIIPMVLSTLGLHDFLVHHEESVDHLHTLPT